MFYPDFRNDVLLFFLLGIMDWITLRGINISHPRPIFEDDLPFPKVEYGSVPCRVLVVLLREGWEKQWWLQ